MEAIITPTHTSETGEELAEVVASTTGAPSAALTPHPTVRPRPSDESPTPPTRHDRHEPERRGWKRAVAVGLVAIVAAGAAVATLRTNDDSVTPTPTPVADEDVLLRELVDQGLVPRQALEPLVPDEDALLRDLVARGLVPRQALEPLVEQVVHPSGTSVPASISFTAR